MRRPEIGIDHQRIAHDIAGRALRDVLQHRQVREWPRDLVVARDAATGDPMRRYARELPALEHQAPRIAAVMAAHHVDQRGLARSVRPDQAQDLPAPYFELDAVERLHALERLRHAADDENCVSGYCFYF